MTFQFLKKFKGILSINHQDKKRDKSTLLGSKNEELKSQIEEDNLLNIGLLLQEGINAFEKEDYESAIKYADRLLEIDPSNAQALNNKGTALEEVGKFEEAIKCFDLALRINPKYIKALNNKGQALKILGRYHEAIKYFDEVLKLDPNYANAIYKKSKTLEIMGNFEESIRVYLKYMHVVIGKDFNDGKEFDEHDKKFLELNKRVSEPMNEFREIIITHNKALDLIALHKFQEALISFDKAILLYKRKKITPENKDFANSTYVNLLNDKSVALLKIKKYKAAIECCDEALRINSVDKIVLKNKEKILKKLREENEDTDRENRSKLIDEALNRLHKEPGIDPEELIEKVILENMMKNKKS